MDLSWLKRCSSYNRIIQRHKHQQFMKQDRNDNGISSSSDDDHKCNCEYGFGENLALGLKDYGICVTPLFQDAVCNIPYFISSLDIQPGQPPLVIIRMKHRENRRLTQDEITQCNQSICDRFRTAFIATYSTYDLTLLTDDKLCTMFLIEDFYIV